MKRTLEQLAKEKKAVWVKHYQWYSILQDAYQLAYPNRDTMNYYTPGQDKASVVYDNTLQKSSKKAANRLNSELFPAFQQWAKVAPGPLIRDDAQKKLTNSVLDQITDITFGHINNSNFQDAAHEWLLEWLIGTANMIILAGDRPEIQALQFKTVQFSEVAIEEGASGKIVGVYRKYKHSRRAIDQQWDDGTEAFTPPEGWAGKLEDDPLHEIEVDEIVYFSKDKWYYHVISWQEGESSSNGHEFYFKEFAWNPWVNTRAVKVPGEVYGRGLILDALPDAKVANKLKELMLRNASLKVAPPYTVVDDGIINPINLRIGPDAIIPVSSNGGSKGPAIQPLEVGGDLGINDAMLKDLQDGIRTMLMDTDLPPETGAVRSATEIIERIKQMQQSVHAPFGRLMSEGIRPIMQNIINILYDQGAYSTVVDEDGEEIDISEFINLDKGFIAIQVTSPYAQAQALEELESTIRCLDLTRNLIGEEIYQVAINLMTIPQFVAEKLSVDTSIYKTEDEIREEMERLQQQAVEMMAQQQEGGIPVEQPAGQPTA